MALLRLDIEVDSDVQPELHAALSTIAAAPSRGERLRQLAAAGLIWEHLRLQAGAPARRERPAADAADASDAAAGAGRADDSAPFDDAPAMSLDFSPRPAPAVQVVAEPIPLATPAPAAGPAVRSMPPTLPVLQDVVEPAPSASAAPSRREAGRRVAAATDTTTKPAAAARTEADAGTGAGTPTRKTGARTRLVRMQEKGLFKNG